MAMKLVRKNSQGDVISWLTHDEDIVVKHISNSREFTYRLKCWCVLPGQSR